MSQNADLEARTWHVDGMQSEMECVRETVRVPVDLDQSALVVIDAWASHPNRGLCDRINGNIPSLVALLNVFRANKRPVFHDSTGLPIHPDVMVGWSLNDILIPWDPMGGGTQIINAHMVAKSVRYIFWAGYNTNLCVMAKPCGFRSVLKQDWDRFHVLVRDATIACESAETLQSQSLLDAACYEVEYYPNGFSCTVAAIESLFTGYVPSRSDTAGASQDTFVLNVSL